jgi:hypothetical protein
MLLAAVSLWTMIPLGWIYIGSKLTKTQFPSAGPELIVITGIIASIATVAWLLSRLNHLYMKITGTNQLGPMRPSWLKSMRDTAPEPNPTTIVEAVLMGSVALAVVAMTIWFFVLAGSPLPKQ